MCYVKINYFNGLGTFTINIFYGAAADVTNTFHMFQDLLLDK